MLSRLRAAIWAAAATDAAAVLAAVSVWNAVSADVVVLAAASAAV